MVNDEGESANLKEWILNRLLLEVKRLPTTFGEFDQEFLSAEALNPFCDGCTGASKLADVEPAVTVNLSDKCDDEKINNLNFNKVSTKCLPNGKINENLLSSPKINVLEISSSEEISSSSGLSIDSKVETNSNTSTSSSVENNLSWPTEVSKPIQPAQPIPVVLPRLVRPQPVFNPNFYSSTPRPSVYPAPVYYPTPVPQFPFGSVPVHTGMPPFNMYQGNSLQQGIPMPMYNPPNWNQSLTPVAGFSPWAAKGKPPVVKASETKNSNFGSTENQNLQFNGPDSKKSICSSNNTNAILNVMSQEFVPVNGASPFDDLNTKNQKIIPMNGASQHSENINSQNVSNHSNIRDTPVLPAKGEVMYIPSP